MRKSHAHRIDTESSWLRDKHIKSETHISLWKGKALTASVCSLSLSLSGAAGVGHSGAWGMREITQLRCVQMAPLKHWLLSPTQGTEWEIESVRGEKRKWQGKNGGQGRERGLQKATDKKCHDITRFLDMVSW